MNDDRKFGSWSSPEEQLDREVTRAAGYGSPGGLGPAPALVIVDVVYSETGEQPKPILEAIEEYRTSCGERAWEALPTIQRLIAASRDAGAPVIYTHNRPRRTQQDLARRGEKNARANEELERWTDRANQIHESIAPVPEDLVIEKGTPSPFFGTTLVPHLVQLGIDSILLVGGTTSGCVRAAAVDAYSYNYKVAVVETGVFDRWNFSHQAALFDLHNRYADVVSEDWATSYLKGVAVDR